MLFILNETSGAYRPMFEPPVPSIATPPWLLKGQLRCCASPGMMAVLGPQSRIGISTSDTDETTKPLCSTCVQTSAKVRTDRPVTRLVRRCLQGQPVST